MGEGKNPNSSHLESLAKKHRLKNADTIISEVKGATAKWENYFTIADVSKSIQKSISKVLISY